MFISQSSFRIFRLRYPGWMSTTISRTISAEDAARLREALARPEAVLRVGSQTVVMSESLRHAVIKVVDELVVCLQNIRSVRDSLGG